MKTCAHCGRQAEILGGSQWTPQGGHVDLCHVRLDGYRADPDCYHLVTTGQEMLGARL